MAARRWYLLVPLVLASVGVAYFAYTQMPAVYTASVVHQINGPASAANGSSDSGSAGGESAGGESSDGDGTSNSFATATALAAQLAKDLQPPGARGRQTPPPYTLTAQPDAPMLTVRADGDSAAKALASVTAVSQRLVTQLATLQNDQRVPAGAQLKLDTPVPAAVAPPVRTTGIKVFAATLLFGLMLSVLLAAAVERSARQRRALLAEDSDELDDVYDRSDEGSDDRSDEYDEADGGPDGPADPASGSEPEPVAAEAGSPAGHPGDEDPTEVVAMPGLGRSRTGSGGGDRDAPTEVAAMSPVRDQPDRRRQPLAPTGGLASSTGQSPVSTGQSPVPTGQSPVSTGQSAVSSSGPHLSNGGPTSSTGGPGGRPLAAAGPPPGRAGSPVRSLAPPPPGNGRSVGAGAVGQLRAVPPGGPASRAGAAAAMGQGAPPGPPARLSTPGGAAPGGSAPGGVTASGGLAPSGGPVPSGASVSGAVPVERGPRAQPPGQGLSGPPPGLSPSGPGSSGPQPAVPPNGPPNGPVGGPPPGGPSRPGQGPSGPLPGRPDGVSGFDSPERRDSVDPLNGPISSSGGLGYHPPLSNPFGGPDSSTFDSSALWAPSSDTGGNSGWLPATPLPAGAPLYGAGPGHDADEESVREWMAEPDRLERPVASLGGDPLGLGLDVLPIGNPFDRSPASGDDDWRGDSPGAEADDFHDSGFGSGASVHQDSGSPGGGSFDSDSFEESSFEESSARGRDDDMGYGDDEPERGEARADRREPSDLRDYGDADYADEDGYDSEYDDAAEPEADDRHPDRRGGEPARSGARGADDRAAARADDGDDGEDDGFGWPEFDEPDAAADGPDDGDGPPTGGSPGDGGPGKGRRDASRQPREAAAGY